MTKFTVPGKFNKSQGKKSLTGIILTGHGFEKYDWNHNRFKPLDLSSGGAIGFAIVYNVLESK